MIVQKLPQDAVIDIVKVEHLPPYTLHLWFSDDAEQILDFEPFLCKAVHPDIRKYLDVELFKQYKILHGELDWNDYELCFPIQDLYEGTLLKLIDESSQDKLAKFLNEMLESLKDKILRNEPKENILQEIETMQKHIDLMETA